MDKNDFHQILRSITVKQLQIKSDFDALLTVHKKSTIIKPSIQTPKKPLLPQKRPLKIVSLKKLKELKLITEASPTRSVSVIKRYQG